MNRERTVLSAAGFAAGAVNGLFGAGGGMILVPLLTAFTVFSEQAIFPASIAIILPVCVVSLLFTEGLSSFLWMSALPYLLGSTLGGILAGIWGQKIPVLWLHRGLGIMILWGGVRYLC